MCPGNSPQYISLPFNIMRTGVETLTSSLPSLLRIVGTVSFYTPPLLYENFIKRKLPEAFIIPGFATFRYQIQVFIVAILDPVRAFQHEECAPENFICQINFTIDYRTKLCEIIPRYGDYFAVQEALHNL
jgi:hypothetical protein